MKFGKLFKKIKFYEFIALCLAALLFTLISAIFFKHSNDNIQFITKEIKGTKDHHIVMSSFFTQPDKQIQNRIGQLAKEYQLPEVYYWPDNFINMRIALMNHIGDVSNLILDPTLSSYYLMNIVIRIAPQLAYTQQTDTIKPSEKKVIFNHLIADLQRSIIILNQQNIPVSELSEYTLILKNWSASTLNQSIIGESHFAKIYNISSSLLLDSLNQRLEEEIIFRRIIMVTIGLIFLIFSLLLIVSIRHYVQQEEFNTAQEKIALLKELEQANEELESFSYFTAHDLKEPLRTVSCFATLIHENHNDELSDDVKQYVDIIDKAAKRMNALIQDLMTYLMHDQVKQHSNENVFLAVVIEDIKNDIKTLIEESNATIEYSNLPSIYTNPFAIRRILQNLIINAIHYSHQEREPEVSISYDTKHKSIIISDNGAGFDMKYAKDIFNPFTRIHDDSSKKGSGIGLAICKKLGHSIDAVISFESSPGNGTTATISFKDKTRNT